MRDQNFVIEDSFKNGLYPDVRVPVNASYLTKMDNLIPDENMGGIFPELPVDPLSSSVTWPFPQYCWDEKVLILANSTALGNVTHTGSTWSNAAITTYDAATPANVKAITTGGTWHFAAFQSNWFLSNGTTLIFKIPSATSSKTLASTATTVQALCKHNDRLILGGIANSTWFADAKWTALFKHWRKTTPIKRYLTDDMAFDTSWVMWCQPFGGDKDIPFHALMCMLGVLGSTAYAKFLPIIHQCIEQGSIGMAPLRKPGTVYSLVSTGDKLLAYGLHGASVFLPEELGFAEKEAFAVSIAGRGGACGEVVVDSQGGIQQNFKQLTYDCWTSSMTLANIVVSKDPWSGQYWITDGTYSYVLTKDGKLGGPMTVKPTSLFRHSVKGLVGAGIGVGASTYAWEIETQNVSMAYRGKKRAVMYQVEADPMTALHGRARMKNGSTFIDGPWLHGGRDNVVYVSASGSELRFGLKDTVTAANAPNFHLSKMTPRFSVSDLRYVDHTGKG